MVRTHGNTAAAAANLRPRRGADSGDPILAPPHLVPCPRRRSSASPAFMMTTTPSRARPLDHRVSRPGRRRSATPDSIPTAEDQPTSGAGSMTMLGSARVVQRRSTDRRSTDRPRHRYRERSPAGRQHHARRLVTASASPRRPTSSPSRACSRQRLQLRGVFLALVTGSLTVLPVEVLHFVRERAEKLGIDPALVSPEPCGMTPGSPP